MTPGNWRINAGAARTAICLCLALSLAACSTLTGPWRQSVPGLVAPPPPAASPETGAKPSAKPSKTVTAFYQGNGTAGQPTASGEPYNPHGPYSSVAQFADRLDRKGNQP